MPQRPSLVELITRHPGVGLSLAYLALSLVGLMFSWSLYSKLGVNIFAFTEVTDLLMAALREPVTIPVAATAVLVVWLLRRLGAWEQRWWQRHPPRNRFTRGYVSLSRRAYRDPVTEIVVLVLYAFLFIELYGEWKAQRIRDGHGPRVTLEIASESGVTELERILVGGTTSYLFLFNQQTGMVEAVPHESALRVISAGPEESTH